MRSLGYLKEHVGNLKKNNNPGYRKIKLVKKKVDSWDILINQLYKDEKKYNRYRRKNT